MNERGFLIRPKARAAALSAALAFVAAGCGGMKLPLNMPHLPRMPWQKAPAAKSAPAAPVASAPISYQSARPATPNSAYGSPVDSVVANVDGNPITSYDVNSFNAAQAASMGGQMPPGAAPDRPDAVLKSLITQQLLENETQKFADKVDEDDVSRYIQTLERRNHITDDQLRAQLQSQGMTYDQFRQRMRQQVEQMTMVDREVRQKIHIPNAEVERYYKEHPDEFTVADEKYTLAQILIAVPANAPPDQVAAAKSKAEGVLRQLKDGKDFGELARQYSDDDSKTKGGELGSFDPHNLNDQILAAVKGVKPGDTTGVVRTKYGFHILKVEDHQIPGEKPFAEVKEQIRDQLMTLQSKGAFQKWVDHDLAREHYVETIE